MMSCILIPTRDLDINIEKILKKNFEAEHVHLSEKIFENNMLRVNVYDIINPGVLGIFKWRLLVVLIQDPPPENIDLALYNHIENVKSILVNKKISKEEISSKIDSILRDFLYEPKVIIIADLHPEKGGERVLKKILEKETPDYVILLGDYSFGNPLNTWTKLRKYEERYNTKIIGIPGNWEEVGEIYRIFPEQIIEIGNTNLIPIFGSKLIAKKTRNECAAPLGINLDFLLGKIQFDKEFYLLIHEIPMKCTTKYDFLIETLIKRAKIIFYGHTHKRDVKVIDENGEKRYLVNPGPGFKGYYLIFWPNSGKFEPKKI